MPIETLKLAELDLGRVDPVLLSTRSGYSKSVRLVFTNGKGESIWRDAGPKAHGATFPSYVKVDESKKECAGTCLVDMFAVGMDSFNPAWISRGRRIPAALSPQFFRYKLVITVVHELAHISQGWQIGRSFGRDYFEEGISAKNRSNDVSQDPDLQNEAYTENVFELGARDFTSRWMNAHVDEVHAGKFDFLVPITILRAMFPDIPNAFR